MINAIIIGLFVIALAIILFLMRKSKLSAIVYEDGESVIRELKIFSVAAGEVLAGIR
jgi:hypothetical protein